MEGVKRFVALSDSPYHGLNFCQGTIAEMCTSPQQVYDAIRYFGSRKRIFWVHFRNIRGTPTQFDEVFPDEGQIDFARAIRVYKEVGYDGVLIPDHVPESADDPSGWRAHAFCLGYIKAMIQMVESEKTA
jgi:mannonate dehydratase